MLTLTPGLVSTVAGNGTAGYAGDGGAASSAQLNYPMGVTQSFHRPSPSAPILTT